MWQSYIYNQYQLSMWNMAKEQYKSYPSDNILANQTIRIGFALIILIVVSLIFYSTIPWISITYKENLTFSNQATFNEKMELTSKNENSWGGDELREGDIGLFNFDFKFCLYFPKIPNKLSFCKYNFRSNSNSNRLISNNFMC